MERMLQGIGKLRKCLLLRSLGSLLELGCGISLWSALHIENIFLCPIVKQHHTSSSVINSVVPADSTPCVRPLTLSFVCRRWLLEPPKGYFTAVIYPEGPIFVPSVLIPVIVFTFDAFGLFSAPLKSFPYPIFAFPVSNFPSYSDDYGVMLSFPPFSIPHSSSPAPIFP